jgi:hypothetical protein
MNVRNLSWAAAAAVVLAASVGAWQWWNDQHKPASEVASVPSATSLPPPTTSASSAPMSDTSLSADSGNVADRQWQLLRWQVRLMAAESLEPRLRLQATIQILEGLARWVKNNPLPSASALQGAIQADLQVLRKAAESSALASNWLDQLWQWEQRLQAVDMSQWLPAESAIQSSLNTSADESSVVCSTEPSSNLDIWTQAQAWLSYSWCEIGNGLRAIWSDSVRIQTVDNNQVLILDPMVRQQRSLLRLQEARMAYDKGDTQRSAMLLSALTQEWQVAQPRWWVQLNQQDLERWSALIEQVPSPQILRAQQTMAVFLELAP